ncbi:MAG: response regulator [Pirellulaceae bacterium]
MRKITLDSLTTGRIDRSQRSPWAALNASIMLFEPQPIFLDILSACFSQRGFTEIQTSSKAQDALAKIDNQQPALIVVGYDEKEQDGESFLKWVKQSASLKSTPTLVITMSAQKAWVQKTYHLNEEDVFCKPVDTGRLITVAIDRISEQGMRDSVSATVRRSRAAPASEKYRRLRKIVGRR